MSAPEVSEFQAAIWVDPARQGGQPCIFGTRIPTEMVATYADMGILDELERGWDYLTHRQLVAACWYEWRGMYSRRSKRGRWVETTRDALWHSKDEVLESVEWPPPDAPKQRSPRG